MLITVTVKPALSGQHFVNELWSDKIGSFS